MVAGIASTQRRVPVPESGMDVQALAVDLICGLRQLAEIGPASHRGPVSEASVDHDQMAQEYQHAAERMRSAWHVPSAIESSYETPWGQMSGTCLVDRVIANQLTHGRELAAATGQATDHFPHLERMTRDLITG